MLGFNVLNLLNAVYTKEKLGAAYSNNMKFLKIQNKLIRGNSSPYPQHVL